MTKLRQKRLFDRLINAYVDWRDASRAVNDAYRRWASATSVGAAVAYARYAEALDMEEFAADVYAGLVQQVARVAVSDRELSGLLDAHAPGT